jgi:hypothetical protein
VLRLARRHQRDDEVGRADQRRARLTTSKRILRPIRGRGLSSTISMSRSPRRRGRTSRCTPSIRVARTTRRPQRRPHSRRR